MTAPAFLRGLEPAFFGSTSEASWLLRERVAAYTRPGVLSEMTGWPSCSDAGSSRLGTDAPPVFSLSASGVRPNPSASGALSLVRNNHGPGAHLRGERTRATSEGV